MDERIMPRLYSLVAYFKSSKKLLKSKDALNTKDSEKVILSDLLLLG